MFGDQLSIDPLCAVHSLDKEDQTDWRRWWLPTVSLYNMHNSSLLLPHVSLVTLLYYICSNGAISAVGDISF